MTYSPLLQQLSERFYERLEQYDRVPVKDYGWENYVWSSPYFRWAHLEKFFTPKVSVLHCVIMPASNIGAPIYGFDVIEMNGNLTGMFLDLTPVKQDCNCELTVPQVGEPRPVPEWGDFFSENFCCCVPKAHDLLAGIQVFKNYIDMLPYCVQSGEDFTARQHQYIIGQRQNPQTYRMLKSHIGEELAKEFIETVLWPI